MCGLSFQKKSELEKFPCPKCKELAFKKLSIGKFSFSFEPDSPKPQNTGATSIDQDEDRVIGLSAQRNTAEYQKRQDYKRSVISSENLQSGDYLSREEDGSYFVMTDLERRAAKKARLRNQEVSNLINQDIKNRRERSQRGVKNG